MRGRQLDEFRDVFGAALKALVVLVAGIVVLIATAVTYAVSERAGFGLWGAVAVGTIAVVVGAATFLRARGRRSRSRGRRLGVAPPSGGGAERGPSAGSSDRAAHRRAPDASAPRSGVTFTPIPAQLARSATPAPPTEPAHSGPSVAGSPGVPLPGAAAAAAPKAPTSVSRLAGREGDPGGASKEHYFTALDAGDLDGARSIVAALRAQGEDPDWCDNAERRISHRRR